MNILPLILALALMLSIMTVEKLEKFKNQTIVQKEYQVFLAQSDRVVFNKRQDRLFGNSQKDHCQLSFRYFIDKNIREKNENLAKQFRQINIALMNILYKDANFYRKLKKTRPDFIEEMVDAIEKAADAAPERTIKRIEDIARLDLKDPELQEAFYHMLKGTISREELKKIDESNFSNLGNKGYLSLFNFINYKGKDGCPVIKIQLAPKEILRAIFIGDDVVEAIMVRRQELADSLTGDSAEEFKNEFVGKRNTDINDTLLDFSITKSDKTEYN